MKTLITTIVLFACVTGLITSNEPKDVEKINTNKYSNSDKYYVWKVKTELGHARGVTTSRAVAERAIRLNSRGEVVESKSIETYKVN